MPVPSLGRVAVGPRRERSDVNTLGVSLALKGILEMACAHDGICRSGRALSPHSGALVLAILMFSLTATV